jgi:polar amino acid transport system substrate-binding protein
MLHKRIIAIFLSFISSLAFAQQNIITLATLEYPPFIYSDGNQVKGPIVDKVVTVFDKLGIKVNLQILPIARGLLMVKNGEVDGFFSLKKTPERENDLLFTTVPLVTQRFVFFIHKSLNLHWNGNLEELKNYRIGVVSKTSYGPIFDKCIKNGILTNIDEAQSFELNIKKLIAGRIDLVINSYDVGEYLIKKLGAENQIIAIEPPIDTINSYLAFTRKRDYASLATNFDNILKEEE